MAITVISCIFCLMHLRSAALLLTVVVIIPYRTVFTLTRNPIFIAVAINLLLVTAGMIFILLRNYADFASPVTSQRALLLRQAETERLSDVQLQADAVRRRGDLFAGARDAHSRDEPDRAGTSARRSRRRDVARVPADP